MCVSALLCDIFMSGDKVCYHRDLYAVVPTQKKGKQLRWICFSEHDFCSFPAPTMLHLTMKRLMPVITASTVICCVSRHDGYLCTGHLSFPPSRALPQFVLSLSLSLGLLVICPAWVDFPKVSCSTLTTTPLIFFIWSRNSDWMACIFYASASQKPDKCWKSFGNFCSLKTYWLSVCDLLIVQLISVCYVKRTTESVGPSQFFFFFRILLSSILIIP